MDTLPPTPCTADSWDNQFVFPASFAQQRLWLLDQLEGASATYNIHDTRLLRGSLDIKALQQAVQTIVQRHETLRTAFDFIDDQPVQIVAAAIDFVVPVLDFTTDPEADRHDRAKQYAIQESQQPFDLKQNPLLRVTLLRLGTTAHLLLVTIHHIIADAWSIGLFWQELSQLYPAFVQATAAPLPPLPIQYADYTLWQRERLQGERLEHQLNYWKQKLGGELGALQLPTDRPRPPQQTFIGEKAWITLVPELLQPVKAFSRQEGCTLFMTILAAWQTLLYRYSGQVDIAVGTPIAGRSQVETEGLIGFFANTLVLRSDLSGEPSFRELLQRVRQTTLEAYEYPDLPFEKLVQELPPARDRSRHPLFQVMLVLHNMPAAPLALPGLTSESLLVDNGTTKFDLMLSLQEQDDSLEGTITYSTDLFDAATIDRLCGHFQVILTSAIADPDQAITTLPILTAAEQQQILVEWNHTSMEFSRSTGIHQLLEAQADRTPDAIAVRDEQSQLTYAELNAKANQLAHYLQSQGVKPGIDVGLLVDRSVEMLVALLGILKAGGTYVPIDPSYPAERIAFILTDAQVVIVLTQQQFVGLLQMDCICLDREQATITAFPTTNLAVAAADLTAYVIYTSGSTGMPKGVEISHRSVVNLLVAMQQETWLTPADVMLAVTTISFDISILELYLPLMVGASLVIASRSATRDPHQLMQLIERSAITILDTTPATWQMLLEAGWQGQPQLKILCGGDVLSEPLAQALRDRGAALWNVYGPTETTVISTVGRILPDTPVSVGRPIGNTQIYILDRHLQPVPVGVLGELYIGGAGLAQGYRQRPELTAKKFIPHPFSPSDRLYKTGDLARYRPDGQIEFLGRIDHQVKVRGFRVELEEISAVLAQHPALESTIVRLREDDPGDQRLVAYVVFHPGMAVETAALRLFLQQKLPDYMIPSAYIPLEQWPITPNGKVDRAALPRPEQSHLPRSATFVPPQTDLEQQLAEIWQAVLNQPSVGIHDNFFELGGHSLLATQVTARIRQRFQVQLPLRYFFDQPTIAALAIAIAQRQTQPNQAPKIQPVTRAAWRK
jgi:surfactin family lipopeptide synthetase A